MSGAHKPKRAVVTGPRGRSHGARAYRRATAEIEEQTGPGQVYMRSLIRGQLRLGLLVCLSTCGVLAVLPLAFAVFPRLGTVVVAGVRLPWLVLGFLVYPVLVTAGWTYMRHAEHHESEFTDLVRRP